MVRATPKRSTRMAAAANGHRRASRSRGMSLARVAGASRNALWAHKVLLGCPDREAMAVMTARFGKRDRSGAKLRTVRIPDTRDQFVSKAATCWVGAVMAVTLFWCGCALAAEPRVILLRGWFGVFSTGLDGLAN